MSFLRLLSGVWLTVVALLLPAPTLAQKTAPRPQVYRTRDSTCTVTVLRYGPPAAQQALVAIVSPGHPWDRHIFLTASRSDGRCGVGITRHQIILHGEDWDLLTNRFFLDQRVYNFELELLDNGDAGLPVTFDLVEAKKLTERASADSLLTAYRRQEAKRKTSLARYVLKAKAGAEK